MERFYTYLLDGKGKADALRLAQIDVRAESPSLQLGGVHPLWRWWANRGDCVHRVNGDYR